MTRILIALPLLYLLLGCGGGGLNYGYADHARAYQLATERVKATFPDAHGIFFPGIDTARYEDLAAYGNRVIRVHGSVYVDGATTPHTWSVDVHANSDGTWTALVPEFET